MEDDDLETKNHYLHGTYRAIREIKLFYDLGEYEMAYDEAINSFDYIDYIIPDEVWLKIGGKINGAGKKIKRRTLGSSQRIEMNYKKSLAMIPVFKDVIKSMPPEGKVYSKPWLWDLYETLLRKRPYYIEKKSFVGINTGPEIDKLLVRECFKWLKKFEKDVTYWRSRNVDIGLFYETISGMTIAYSYFLKQREKKGVGSFIDIVYKW